MRFLFSRKLWLFSIAGALAAHLVLYGLLGLGWSDVRDRLVAAEGEEAAVAIGGEESAEEKSPAVDVQRLAGEIEAGVSRLVTVPVEKQIDSLRKNADWLQRNSSAVSVDEISLVVRQATGAPDRAYAPVEPPPPGEFDMKSMLIYSSRKITGEDGLERAERTWVDKAGRTMKQTLRKGTDDQGKPVTYLGVYMPDGSLFETPSEEDGVQNVLDTVSESPLLQRLYQQTILPALEARRTKQPQK